MSRNLCILSSGAYGPQADIWSLGCIMYEILVGKTAFPYTRNESELYARIKGKKLDTTCREFTCLSESCKSLLHSMLTINPEKRCSATEALRHPWIADPSSASDVHLSDSHSSLTAAYKPKK